MFSFMLFPFLKVAAELRLACAAEGTTAGGDACSAKAGQRPALCQYYNISLAGDRAAMPPIRSDDRIFGAGEPQRRFL
ncbi:hypothetical protein [Cereibacter azotoformans]|uniref:hypothetical protein n=1 Tax=Cereibacter azotoformans TaxID=43057 RepID=UPI001179ED2E|nr:hypothetical protein [Cereibacter azotoformans]